jgi:hypothetical protein
MGSRKQRQVEGRGGTIHYNDFKCINYAADEAMTNELRPQLERYANKNCRAAGLGCHSLAAVLAVALRSIWRCAWSLVCILLQRLCRAPVSDLILSQARKVALSGTNDATRPLSGLPTSARR